MILLILITAALAQEPEAQNTTVIDFEDVELKGKIDTPTALLLLGVTPFLARLLPKDFKANPESHWREYDLHASDVKNGTNRIDAELTLSRSTKTAPSLSRLELSVRYRI